MKNGKTVFIVGAGASKELGLPLGEDLKTKVSKICDIRFGDGYSLDAGDHNIVNTLKKMRFRKTGEHDGSINPYLYAGWKIRNNMPLSISIDNFMDAHSDDPDIIEFGKLAIAAAMLDAERACPLNDNDVDRHFGMDFSKMSKVWHLKLTQMLTQGAKVSEVPKIISKISFISFNYDRCIAQFLMKSLSSYFSIDESETADLLAELKILHPYGSLGELPWQEGVLKTTFGSESYGDHLIEISKNIKTFTEQIESEDTLDAIKSEIESADTIVFLGFGFHKQNLELIEPREICNIKSVLGTCSGISDSDREIIANEIARDFLSGRKFPIIFRSDLHCFNLFNEYWRTLSNA